ncbi:MAG: cytochrome C oxidase subunit IV family protein [Sulfurimicrobium sp.]|nr:cytochrome C oxidase subunit IV family protein [Sulfurimicrobium sp.]MDP1703329.1 cytochrome C oxidase subunit IV family protein [Sulfurimicrobium sp.]MDP1897960.1 cytochrome C oxidase subunit IV family protein [Sulfurimicrobium sp.]MDP2197851.1 cytochrome C oxidase subunit IV family protein [Sulfurimicrobium sp.]MDP3689375.1 cytochrome C oxidase subunit IV family protein [Sulfurimicrobium sp.]
MTHEKLLDRLWLLLVALTLGGAWIGEAVEPGLAVTLIISLTMAFKGRIVVDHFMELKTANRMLRNLMRGFFYVLPAVNVLTILFGDWLARLTTL